MSLQRKLERIGEKKAVKMMEKESFPIKLIGEKRLIQDRKEL